MDVKVVRKKSSIYKNKYFQGILFILVLLVSYKSYIQRDTEVLDRDNLILAPVLKGDLHIEIEGYGQLKSKIQRLITSFSKATVSEVLLKPGASVQKDSVIAILANPELELEVKSAQYQRAKLQTDLQQEVLEQERALLAENVSLDKLKAEYEAKLLLLEAQAKLATQGIVSIISYKKTQLEVAQLKREISSKEEQVKQLARIHRIVTGLKHKEIAHHREFLALMEDRLKSLEVKAGFSGILQKLYIEIGQNLSTGQEIALVGSNENLIALIRVPQGKAQQIALGMASIIDTRQDTIMGKVSRIDPIVEDNTVEVEIELTSPLPDSARPELNVDGIIKVGTLHDILYVKRPVNVVVGQIKPIYQLEQQSDQATLVDIEFGKSSGKYIVVRAGAVENQVLIISDLTSYALTHTNLTIQ